LVEQHVDDSPQLDAAHDDPLVEELDPCHASDSARTEGRGNSADRETVFVLHFGPGHVDVFHASATRPAAAPVDHRLDPLVVALEPRLDRAVGRISDPACEAERARSVPRLDPEEDALHGSAHDDFGPLHLRKPCSPTSGTKRHGTEWTTAGPSGLRTITSSRWPHRRPTGTVRRPRGSSCS